LDADLADVGGGGCPLERIIFFRSSIPMVIGAASSKATRCSRPTTFILHTQLESGDPGRLQRAFTEMMRYQNEDGSWSLYPGGPGNISLSVKCYFSAKLMGIGPDDPRLSEMPRVGSGAWRRGGDANTFTKMYLCGLGRIRLRRGACHSAGDRSVSELVLL
jgi:squalene-hopene/tetraprenyl-beta-curcumene cyclase